MPGRANANRTSSNSTPVNEAPPLPQPQDLDHTTLPFAAPASPPSLLGPAVYENHPPSTCLGRVKRFLKTGWGHLPHGLHYAWLDLLFLLLVISVCIIIMKAGDIYKRRDRLFPMTYDNLTGTWIGPPELSYPRKEFTIPIATTAIAVPLVPSAIIHITTVFVRSARDSNAAHFALWKGLAIVQLTQLILKNFIGEFRPHFITMCNPKLPDPFVVGTWNNTDVSTKLGGPARRVYASVENCRYPRRDKNEWGKHHTFEDWDPIKFAMQSYPSGHTMNAFYIGVFIALYLNAKLKAFSDYHTSLWKLLAVVLPVLGSMIIAGSLMVDRNHHPHDIILSIPIGVILACLCWRCHFASLFDYRTNHLPLPWSSSHRSLHNTVPAPPSYDKSNHSPRFWQGPRFKHPKNFTAVSWPRKPRVYNYGGNQHLETTVAGLDGAGEGPPLAPPFGITRSDRVWSENASGRVSMRARSSLSRRSVVDGSVRSGSWRSGRSVVRGSVENGTSRQRRDEVLVPTAFGGFVYRRVVPGSVSELV